MKADGSLKVILAALIGNGLIAIAKFTGSIYTGSSAMLSEAIHSLVDTGNQGLLLYGMKRAKRPADARHPFGYGGEIYFWAFVVAVLIFAGGAGFSIYEGLHKLKHPEPMTDIFINYIILSAAIVFEGGAWYVAYKEFNKTRGEVGYVTAIRGSKDPRIFTVLLEDTGAMLGLIVAMVGIAIADATGLAWVDGATSIVIGLILAGIAIILCIECKGLLIGEAAAPDITDKIKATLTEISDVASVNEVLTVHFGPEDVLVNISLDFKRGLTTGTIETTVTKLETLLKDREPHIKRIFIEVQDKAEHLGESD